MDIKGLVPEKIKNLKDIKIRPSFPFYSQSKNLQEHVEMVRKILLSYLPSPLPFDSIDSLKVWIKENFLMILK